MNLGTTPTDLIGIKANDICHRGNQLDVFKNKIRGSIKIIAVDNAKIRYSAKLDSRFLVLTATTAKLKAYRFQKKRVKCK